MRENKWLVLEIKQIPCLGAVLGGMQKKAGWDSDSAFPIEIYIRVFLLAEIQDKMWTKIKEIVIQ